MAIAPFDICRVVTRDLAVTAAADPALVAHLQSTGVNHTPVTVTRRLAALPPGAGEAYEYDVVAGHEVVAAARAAGLGFVWVLIVDAEAMQAEQAVIAAAPAAPEAPAAAEPVAVAEPVGTATVAAETGVSRSALNAWARTHGAGSIRHTASGAWHLVGKAGRTWQWVRA